ncbi:hypothetical protein ACFYP6_10120 [Streptomyces goshikiensis]|uniref:hypothetical protein n=1 Tax=Streptomyces goshikiensis TaxID=1942 RepID=UPI0036A2FC29
MFCSLDDLKAALEYWIKVWNDDARPFKWTKATDQILDRICRYCLRISEPDHQGVAPRSPLSEPVAACPRAERVLATEHDIRSARGRLDVGPWGGGFAAQRWAVAG